MKLNRRTFLSTGAAASLGAVLVSRGFSAESSKLQHAAIGVQGMGRGDLQNISSHPGVKVVALCDVDGNHLAQAAKQFPDARTYRDYRELLEKEGDKVDSVNISVPDHMHAPIAKAAMEHGKHVYCQKPLTHEVAEARMMTNLAKDKGVITQMGNQIHSHIAYRLGVAWIQAGAIGKVKEVHSWVNASYAHAPRPAGEDFIPPQLNWDYWLGSAPVRPYKKGLYHPFEWRRWQDFGTGAMGDFGCHILDPVHTALKLAPPLDIECVGLEQAWLDNESRFSDSWPAWGIVKYTYPGSEFTTGKTLPVTWYDGGKQPTREQTGLPEGVPICRSGSVFLGENGVMMLPHVGAPRMFPEEKFRGFPKPDIPEVINHYHTWIDHVKEGKLTSDGFHYAGPLAEAVLLGTIAQRHSRKKMKWYAASIRLDLEAANALLSREWREV